MTKTSKIFEQLKTLEVSSDVKNKIADYVAQIEKEVSRKDFIIDKIEKEKYISGQILNNTIKDLQDKQQEIVFANEKLLNQKQEIELKNLELVQRKVVVDNQQILLKRKFEEMESSYKELEQFSYIASHDLKSPLRNIGTFAQLLQKKLAGKLDKQENEFINFIVKGTHQMNSIIDDLLKFSRIGVKEGDFQMLDINEILELVQFNLTQEVKENDVLLEVEQMPTALYANRSSLIQLFQNLISNAIKFKSDRRPLIRVGVEELPDCFIFSVRDNGVGMDEKFQKKAFEPFQRLNNQERPGTGMGLAICRKIAMLHKGDIRYESVVGQGTDFYFKVSKGIGNQNGVQKILVESSN